MELLAEDSLSHIVTVVLFSAENCEKQLHCNFYINPIALRTARALWSFGCSECNMVNISMKF